PFLCHLCYSALLLYLLFSFNTPPTTHIYTLSLHDALPISFAYREQSHSRNQLRRVNCRIRRQHSCDDPALAPADHRNAGVLCGRDRKSTRLNSSHSQISYAVFCLKKKNKKKHTHNNM